MEGPSVIMRRSIPNSEDLRNNEQKLVSALQMLFDLLEEYAPQWYTKEHHEFASEALATATGGLRPSSDRRTPKGPMAA